MKKIFKLLAKSLYRKKKKNKSLKFKKMTIFLLKINNKVKNLN